MFFGKGVLKIYGKFTGEHPCLSVNSIKLLWNHTLRWVFSCKFAAYFQNAFLEEHLWRVPFVLKTYEKLINPLQPSRAIHSETSHLICSANQVTGFYMKCNTELKRIKHLSYCTQLTAIPSANLIT